jgi:hypothetical protein
MDNRPDPIARATLDDATGVLELVVCPGYRGSRRVRLPLGDPYDG